MWSGHLGGGHLARGVNPLASESMSGLASKRVLPRNATPPTIARLGSQEGRCFLVISQRLESRVVVSF